MLLRTNAILQNQEEYLWYTKFSIGLKVERYLEIGSYKGDTFYSVIANAPTGSLGVSIDTNVEPSTETIRELDSLGYRLRVLQGDSKSEEMINYAKSFGPYDLILIDGDHSYDGVKADWENYHYLAPVVVIHDVMGRDNEFTKDVYRFWQELKVDKRYIEVNLSNYQLGYGVIFR